MSETFKIFDRICSIFCLLASILLSSCEMYHFAYPLPVDAKNIYTTPKKLRGFVSNADGNREDYLLEKKSITGKHNDTIKVIDGIWFSVKDTSRVSKSDTAAWKKLDNLKSYTSRYTIKFDSSKVPVDTIENYIIRGDKIYNVDKDEFSSGMPFTKKADTLYVIPNLILTDLGPSAFFRKVSRDYYLLNIRDNVFIESHYPWWQVVLIEIRKDGKVMHHYWNRDIESNPALIYSSDSNYYFDGEWTRKDILKLINDGAFEKLNEKTEVE